MQSDAGSSFLLKDLKEQGFRAIFLAIGAHRSKDLRMEGMDLDGVLRGVEFLLNVNLGFRVWLGHKVVVIGGGNVAVDVARTAAREGSDPEAAMTTMDVARAARRLGSREVHVICLESRDEMPAHGYEVEEAEKEGIIFHPSTGPTKVVGVNGKVAGLQTRKCISVFDADGRFNPRSKRIRNPSSRPTRSSFRSDRPPTCRFSATTMGSRRRRGEQFKSIKRP